MNTVTKEAAALAAAVVKAAEGVSHRVLIAPPYTALHAVLPVISGTNVELGAQNASCELAGAHTGEISVTMLADLGVTVVILGHSERRQIYFETDELINKKIHTVLAAGLEVIFCVGETLDEREAGRAVAVVEEQLKNGLVGVDASQLSRLTLAYEPVWAIGTGKTATPDDADEIHAAARKTVATMYNSELAENLVVQYGGSVKPDNVRELMAKPNIDGALVGGASLSADSFGPIVRFNS